MSADHDAVEALLASISDGSPPDWLEAERGTGDGGRARLESARELARIAEFCRGLQRVDEPSVAPQRWGDLLLLERLGTGAEAEVHRAWDAALQREVALKLMRPGAEDASLLAEGRAAAKIRHPHVVTVHGIDRRDGRIGLWMELVRGSTLEQAVRAHQPLDAAAAARLGAEMSSALAAVHAAGILHRDIKPANVVRDAGGRYVLADFGLGLRGDQAVASGPSGTPMYMAPELIAGAPATERTDLYSLGLLLWFALAGRHPFTAEGLAELAAQKKDGPRPGLRELRPDLPAGLVAIVERASHPDPSQRLASAHQLSDAFAGLGTPDPVSPGAPPRSRIPFRALALVALVTALGIAAIGPWRARRADHEAPGVAPPVAPGAGSYAVEASFLRRDRARGGAGSSSMRLVTGDRVRPGDRLSLEVRSSQPMWVYVLNEDERGEHYLLFPQPRFDVKNPLARDSTFALPGPIDGKENAWVVTSAGGREYMMVVASPQPVPEIEAELGRLPAPVPGRPIEYAPVARATVERLRGVGGVAEVPATAARPAVPPRAFDGFRALAGRETGVQGVWVRQIVLENPAR